MHFVCTFVCLFDGTNPRRYWDALIAGCRPAEDFEKPVFVHPGDRIDAHYVIKHMKIAENQPFYMQRLGMNFAVHTLNMRTADPLVC